MILINSQWVKERMIYPFDKEFILLATPEHPALVVVSRMDICFDLHFLSGQNIELPNSYDIFELQRIAILDIHDHYLEVFNEEKYPLIQVTHIDD